MTATAGHAGNIPGGGATAGPAVEGAGVGCMVGMALGPGSLVAAAPARVCVCVRACVWREYAAVRTAQIRAYLLRGRRWVEEAAGSQACQRQPAPEYHSALMHSPAGPVESVAGARWLHPRSLCTAHSARAHQVRGYLGVHPTLAGPPDRAGSPGGQHRWWRGAGPRAR